MTAFKSAVVVHSHVTIVVEHDGHYTEVHYPRGAQIEDEEHAQIALRRNQATISFVSDEPYALDASR